MKIAKFLYVDLPKGLTAIRSLRNTSTIHSSGLAFKLLSENWITKYRARSLVEAKYFTEFFCRNNFPLFIIAKCFHIIYIKLCFPTNVSYKTRL